MRVQTIGLAFGRETLDRPEVMNALNTTAPMLGALADCPVATIAATDGLAAGVGASLALVADLAIAARSAVFTQAYARIGLIPDAGGGYRLPRQIGAARAMGAVLRAAAIPAERAEAWGMIWQAVPDADFAQGIVAFREKRAPRFTGR